MCSPSTDRSHFRFCATAIFSCVFTIVLLCASSTRAVILPYDTNESDPYLIIARMSINGSVTLGTSNFELGANKAPVPSTDSFLNSGGGPTLLGAVPDLPGNAATVGQGIGGHGNLAITDPDGELNLSNVGVYADPGIGIQMASNSDSDNKSSNSFFNDPNMFPNTFDINTQTGILVGPGDANQTTRIDASNNKGVTFGTNFSNLDAQLAANNVIIGDLNATNTLIVSGGNAGQLENSSTIGGTGGASIAFGAANSLGGVSATITVPSGLNVIDVVTGDNDFNVEEANLVIDGPSDAVVVIRLSDSDNMLVTDSNILAGQNIGLNKILFFTDQLENDSHFNMNNTIINGVAFWSLGSSDIAEIVINNAQGCTQLIAEDIHLNAVRLTRCFHPPEPSTFVLLSIALGFLFGTRRPRH